MHGIVLTPTFLRQAEREGLSEDDLFDISSSIAADPLGGDLMSGTGGAKKVRHAGAGDMAKAADTGPFTILEVTTFRCFCLPFMEREQKPI